MEYKKFDNIIIARIDKGEEILEQLKAIAINENIKLASINAIGAVNDSRSEYIRRMRRNIAQTALKDIMKSHR